MTVRDLANHIKKAARYEGKVEFDVTKPDGTPRKLLDCSRLHAMGWRHRIELDEGIQVAYEDFIRMFNDKSYAHRF